MAYLWPSGFELNALSMEFNITAGAAMTIVTSPVRSGTYAARVTGLSSGTRSGAFKSALVVLNLTYICFYFRYDTLPSAENTISFIGASISSPNYWLKLTTAGTLKLYDVDNSTVIGTSAAMSAGTWYRVEYGISASSATDIMQAFLDGTQWITDGVGNAGTSAGLFLGGNGDAEAQTTGDWFFDDVCVSGTAFPGAGSLVCLRPNAAGDFTEGASGTAGTGFDDIDEVTPDDVTSYWLLQDPSSGATDADRLDVNIEAFAPSASAIEFVAVGLRVMPETSATCTFTPRIKSQASGTIVEGTTVTITGTAWVTNDDTATASIYKLFSLTDPQAGGAWTQALLGTTQIGVRAPDATPDVRVTAMWAYVRYTPSVGGATSILRQMMNYH